MKTGINIGGDMMREAAPEIAGAIERIFDSGYANRMDQSTICTALNVLLKCSEVSNVNINNCVLGDN